MIHAYDKLYLSKAQAVLARMLDIGVNELNYSLKGFFSLFIKTGLADRFGAGDYTLLVGMSGVELAYTVLESSGKQIRRKSPRYDSERSVEYWTGWVLAYYQWETALRFSEIIRAVPIERIASLYSPYHEMDIRQFCDRMNELYRKANQDTNLKRLRKSAGMSQSILAEISGVPLRTIQQYEQRRKNINKAQAEYLVMLAQALCCRVEDLLEKVEQPEQILPPN